MATPKLLTLDEWAKQTYGDSSPCKNTLRAWCRTGKIQPPPIKHGRSYFVLPDAENTPFDFATSLRSRLYPDITPSGRRRPERK